MGSPAPLPRTLPEPKPAIDEETLRRLEAQLPRPGGDLLEGSPRPERPTWLALSVLAVVVAQWLLPPLTPYLWPLVWSLCLIEALRRRTRVLRSTSDSDARERIGGECWLLAGCLMLFLPVPLRDPWWPVVVGPKVAAAAFAFGVGIERRILRPRRRRRGA